MIPLPLEPGDPPRLGGYELVGRLGVGGQGVVYLGRRADGPEVAVKLLHARLLADAQARARFVRELAVLQRVAGFCTAQMLEADTAGDQPYIVSEFVSGPSLRELVAEQGPRTGADLERLAIGTVTALAAIHRAGIVHRDFKPHNVLIGPDGPRVIDFGIARALDAGATLTSQIIGTPAYMSPEQFAGGAVGPSADLYAWGATMIFAATGRDPHGGGALPAVMYRVLHEAPDLTGLPPQIAEIVGSCMNKDPAARPTAEQVLLRLLGEGGETPPTTRAEAPGSGSRTPPPGDRHPARAPHEPIELIGARWPHGAPPAAGPAPTSSPDPFGRAAPASPDPFGPSSAAPGASAASGPFDPAAPAASGPGVPAGPAGPAASSGDAVRGHTRSGSPGPSGTIGYTRTPDPSAAAGTDRSTSPYERMERGGRDETAAYDRAGGGHPGTSHDRERTAPPADPWARTTAQGRRRHSNVHDQSEHHRPHPYQDRPADRGQGASPSRRGLLRRTPSLVAGLVLASLLAILDLAALAIFVADPTESRGRPVFIAVAGVLTLLAMVTIVAVAVAWRGGRTAVRSVIALRIVREAFWAWSVWALADLEAGPAAYAFRATFTLAVVILLTRALLQKPQP